jgi:Tfp pilus assembly protein PilF
MAPPPAARALTAVQASRLQAAFSLFKGGNPAGALDIARGLVAECPESPDARQLMAICLDGCGDTASAETQFQAALELAPGHAAILANFSAFQVKRGLAALQAGQTTLALALLDDAVSLHPRSATAWHALGNAHRAQGDPESAASAFRKAIEFQPASATSWLNLGACLRMSGQLDEAMACLDRAAASGQAGPEIGDARAGLLLDQGRVQAAIEQARAVVRKFPEFAPGHRTLADLQFEYGQAEDGGVEPMAEFRSAVDAHPANGGLGIAFVACLLAARRGEEALARIRAMAGRGSTTLLTALEADALAQLGEDAAATRCYEQAHQQWRSSDPDFLNAYARHLLRTRDWGKAARLAEEATRVDPGNQQSWAYLATAWRLAEDPREFWLCDYERLIALVDVPTPAPFADREGFLAALQSTLEPLHQANHEPAQQSLRGGSQTSGRLFGRRDAVIEATRTALLSAIETHLASLPVDERHPFLARKAASVRFTGSWSVRLWSSGSHVNHIHQEGWMSSAFYVSLPPSVRAASAGDAGWIQFGQPPVELGLGLEARRKLRPEPGKLALFPSYLWHGTVPFVDSAPRLTIAFDMTPRQDPP